MAFISVVYAFIFAEFHMLRSTDRAIAIEDIPGRYIVYLL